MGCFQTHFAIHKIWTLLEDFDSVCRCVVNPAGWHRSERDRNGGGCIRNSLQLNLSTLKIMILSRFFGFDKKHRSRHCKILVRAQLQQRQQNLKSLEGQCFLQGFARVSFTKSEAFERHIRMASEQLWVSLLRQRRHKNGFERSPLWGMRFCCNWTPKFIQIHLVQNASLLSSSQGIQYGLQSL